MLRLLFTIALVLIPLAAQAGHRSPGGFGFGGPFFGGWYGGFHGFGWRGFDTERIQTRFVDKSEELMSEYDTGLAEIDDFYNSDEYFEVVDGMENLIDRYDFFLMGVERKIDRLEDVISLANDDLLFYTDLIAEYEARDDLSEERLERIVSRLTNIQDRLTTTIDLFTEKETTLNDNFGTYQLFSDDLDAYLAEIVAGGGTTDTSEILAATAPVAAMALFEEMSLGNSPQLAQAATAVPEPTAGILFAVALLALAIRHVARI